MQHKQVCMVIYWYHKNGYFILAADGCIKVFIIIHSMKTTFIKACVLFSIEVCMKSLVYQALNKNIYEPMSFGSAFPIHQDF